MLFDTGLVCWRLLRNLRKWEISPDSIERVVISHGHMDHVRGIKALAKARTTNEKLIILGHPNIIEPKRAHMFGRNLWNAGFPKMEQELMDKIEFKFNTDLVEIEPKIYLSGEISLDEREEEKNLSRFFWHEINGEWKHDPMIDEQCLIIKAKEGLVILSGDSHPGLKNTLLRVEKLFSEKIYAFIGGLHLTKSTNKKIEKIAEDIKQNFSYINFYLNHTATVRAVKRIRKELGGNIVRKFHLGSELIFEY